MKIKIFSAIVLAAAAIGCSKSPAPMSNSTMTQKDPLSVSSHSSPVPQAPAQADNTAGGKSKWTQGGDAIDTTAFDTAISKAEKEFKASPSNGAKKVALGTAYAARGTALTEARQYAAALGDFRRAMKYDPSNTKAKEMMEEIISIYESMNRDYPKEGEEPEPKRK